MVERFLVYNFLGRANDLSDLIPNERFAVIAGILKSLGKYVEIRDGANIYTLLSYPPAIAQEVERLEFYDTDQSKEYLDLLEKEAQSIARGDFDVIFLNLWRGPGFKFSVELARRVKELVPDIAIYAIGQGADRIREGLLKIAPHIDAVMYGLGYEGVELIARGSAIYEVPNVICFYEGKIKFTHQKVLSNINSLPFPLYGEDIYQNIRGKFPIYPIALSNEACPFACPFCMRPASYGIDVVAKDIPRAVDELEYLIKEYNARYFRIVDSTPPFMALTRFAEEIMNRGLYKYGLHFSGFSRLDVNSSDDFELLRKAGVEALFFGIETLDDNMQKSIKKVHPYDNLKNTLRRCHEAGIFTIGSFIFPLPGETEESMANTLARLREIRPYLDSVLLQPAGVYPMTEWRFKPEEYGIKMHPDYDEVFPVYPVKYILPIRYWRPFPFTYDLMGKPAEEVKYEDIVNAFERFCGVVSQELGLPIGVQDYDVLAAILLNEEHSRFTKQLINAFVKVDYPFLKEIIETAHSRL